VTPFSQPTRSKTSYLDPVEIDSVLKDLIAESPMLKPKASLKKGFQLYIEKVVNDKPEIEEK
jgi:hypothetical protein